MNEREQALNEAGLNPAPHTERTQETSRVVEESSLGAAGARQLRSRCSAEAVRQVLVRAYYYATNPKQSWFAVRRPASAGRPGAAPLPQDVPYFVGRQAELDRLRQLLVPTAGPRLAVIRGQPGSGKTALATHFGHQTAEHFPDGRLLVDLQTPRDVAIALGAILRHLGVPGESMPRSEEALAELYRSMAGQRRLLVILDGATSTDQVQRLLPRSPLCAVIVTVREPLRGLAGPEIHLGDLEERDAVALIAAILGDGRVDANTAAAKDLARLCARHPVAVSVAAARLALDPDLAVGDLMADHEVTDQPAERRDAFPRVRTAFLLAYDGLTPELQRVFRFLGLTEGPDFSVQACAALLDAPNAQAQAWLIILEKAGLVTQSVPGRYRQHELLRRFALERARLETSKTVRDRALRRLLSYYLGYARHYGDQLGRHRRTLDSVAYVNVSGSAAERASALEWFEGERRGLVAAVRQAARSGMRQYAYWLADACYDFLELRRYGRDNIDIHKIGQQAAQLAGDRLAAAQMLHHLSLIEHALGNNVTAFGYANMAHDIYDSLKGGYGDDYGKAAIQHHLARVKGVLGQYDEAIEHAKQALDGHQRISHRRGQAEAHASWAHKLFHQADYDEAMAKAEQALSICREIPADRGEADALIIRARLLHARQKWEKAKDDAERALEIRQRMNDTSGEAEARIVISRACRQLGHLVAGRDHAMLALDISRETGNRHAEGQAHVELGQLLLREAELDEAYDQFNHALRLERDTGHLAGQVRAYLGIGMVYDRRGRYRDAQEYLELAYALASQLGDPPEIARTLEELARTLRRLRRLGDAKIIADQALNGWRQLGHKRGQAAVLGGIARIHLRADQLDDALTAVNESLEIRNLIGDIGGTGIALDCRARILMKMGHPQDALRDITDALDKLHNPGMRFELAEATRAHARILLDLNRTDEAYRQAHQAREVAPPGALHVRWSALVVLGLVCQRKDQHDEAVRHLRHAEEILVDIGDQHGQLKVLKTLHACLNSLSEHAGARRCTHRIQQIQRWLLQHGQDAALDQP